MKITAVSFDLTGAIAARADINHTSCAVSTIYQCLKFTNPEYIIHKKNSHQQLSLITVVRQIDDQI